MNPTLLQALSSDIQNVIIHSIFDFDFFNSESHSHLDLDLDLPQRQIGRCFRTNDTELLSCIDSFLSCLDLLRGCVGVIGTLLRGLLFWKMHLLPSFPGFENS